ncbi:hypothetical protein [Arthrobacter sp. PsM3]|uniref:hypothetical protein n=1 Tax=Arthrobacter sp. PsM3 TaxID=3030531 RepID=UPI00263B6711|nr:hypothetical protein [Arthrobacter sp. PsM3]MDN4644947.1 hypothetical protein [Arthrobacter sp. PsM3]
MTITDQQGRAVAYLLHEIRPDWGVASLVSLIDKHRDVPSLGALLIAATTKAMERTCQTPAPIFHPGPHWPAAARAHLPKPEPCPDHVGESAHSCRCCIADTKAGIRPPGMIGKHHTPTSEDDEAPANAGASLVEGDQA